MLNVFVSHTLLYAFCSNQTAWRKANLTSKMSIDALEKEALLNGGDDALRKR